MGAFPYPITGPIAPYTNVPINPQFYQPSQYFISNITLGANTTVTTTVNHDYVIGQLVRLLIPQWSGCRQLNEQTGYVVSIPASDQIVVTVYSLNSDPFTPSSNPNQPQVVAVGDVNTGQINSSGPSSTATSIPGSFMDISPI